MPIKVRLLEVSAWTLAVSALALYENFQEWPAEWRPGQVIGSLGMTMMIPVVIPKTASRRAVMRDLIAGTFA